MFRTLFYNAPVLVGYTVPYFTVFYFESSLTKIRVHQSMHPYFLYYIYPYSQPSLIGRGGVGYTKLIGLGPAFTISEGMFGYFLAKLSLNIVANLLAASSYAALSAHIPLASSISAGTLGQDVG